MPNTLTLFGGLMVVLWGIVPQARGQATFIALGIPPGMTNSHATGASADGSVVVGTVGDASGTSRAFRWTASAGIVVLGILPDAPELDSSAEAISADGAVVVGTSGNAFRWTAETGMVSLGRLPGALYSVARDVSDDGSVVVGYNRMTTGNLAFRWTQQTGMVSLGPVPGYTSSQANSTNADGSVIAGWTGPGFGPGFVWTSQGGMTPLGPLPGDIYAYAGGVSAGGNVILGTSMSPHSSRPFIWTPSGGLSPLPVPPSGIGFGGGMFTNDGTTWFSGEVPGVTRGTWLSNGHLGTIPLSTHLISLGVDLSEWRIDYWGFGGGPASRNGRVLVGDGMHNGVAEAWVAIIPTCGTADFNTDGDTGTDADIESFIACLHGSCCWTCGDADFNGDGEVGTDEDIEAFFRVLAGGHC